MAWSLSGQMMELCNCKMICPCTLGPAEPDEGSCSGALLFDIRTGASDGVDLGGCKAAVGLEMPKDFASGDITGRLYINEGASAGQRRELEAIFQGKKGGNWEAMSAAFSKWLSTQPVKIDMHWGDKPTVQVGNVGKVTLAPIKNDAGKPTTLSNAPLMAPFGDSEALAFSNGSEWNDPDMRPWKGGGNGGVTQFTWTA